MHCLLQKVNICRFIFLLLPMQKQLQIQFKEWLTGQRQLLFPMSPSENQELLETLKREYSGVWMSEVEKILVAQAIQDEKQRPVKA